MIDFFKILFNKNEREIKKLKKTVDLINSLEDSIKKLSDDQLAEKTVEFKERLSQGSSLDDILVEAFAVVREAAWRVLEMRHFDVQLMGGMVLHQGKIAEMKTGEGKTLVETLPVYLNALTGKGVHVVTVNEYLAERDSKWMGQVYEFLGLSVGLIRGGMTPAAKKAAYRSDITYGTNHEFGFDYLRDNMEVDIEDCVQSNLNYAIIDEVDSILIDEARTPHILSGLPKKSSSNYERFDKIAKSLHINKDYTHDEKHRNVILTEEGIKKAEKLLNIENLYSSENFDYSHYLLQSLKAHVVFRKDKDYVVKDGEVILVDEFTGRLMFGRRYSEGLHQAIEAKEKVKIGEESQTVATITLQNYFLMYNKLAGMTGTAKTEEREFVDIYDMEVVVIPTNKPLARKDLPDIIYKTANEKYQMIIDKIIERHEKGQPVLVGTISIEVSEYIADMLRKKGYTCQVLNAKYHEMEASIISEAGKHLAITIATNMAGRGTDIVLDEQARECGGLFVLGTERHESRRIDNQLRGRSGRQGDDGASQFILSLEDDLLRLFGGEKVSALFDRFKIPEFEPIQHPFINQALERAQKKVEFQNFKIRKHVLEYDNVINSQRNIIYKQRREVLESENINDTVEEFITEIFSDITSMYISEHILEEEWELEKLHDEILTRFGFEFDLEIIRKKSPEEAREYVSEKALSYYNEKRDKFGPEIMDRLEKISLLRSVDNEWREYLVSIDSLREGIGLRAYGQKDPLVEYKIETHQMFEGLISRIKDETIEFVFRVDINPTLDLSVEKVESFENSGNETPAKGQTVKRENKKIGRNDPCPCGSGKKYKKCCGS